MRIIYIIITLLTTHTLVGQKIDQMASFRDIEAKNHFRFSYDNDYFSETDRDYTQGYSFEVVSPWLAKNPINYLFFKSAKAKQKYGLLVEHIGFTALNIESTEIQYGDRPFAAAIMLKSYLVNTDTINKQRIAFSFNVGGIGPLAFGKEMQTEIHRAINYTIPGGWRNEVTNDVVVNYGVDYEKRLVKFKNIFSLQANAKGKLGTLYTNASLGFNTTVGIINSPFETDKRTRKFRFYLYAQPLINFVGYDATLQGGLFNKKSPYVISNENIERVTYQLNYGAVLRTRTMYFEYSRADMTREHKLGESIGWGGIKIGFTF